LPGIGLVYTLVYIITKGGAMDTYTEVGAYEAKSHFPEFLRKAKAGMTFRITNRGEHVADLVPPGTAERRGRAQAAKRMQQFVETQAPVGPVDIAALIAEGRD
jgi:antitoxin (DNA-binding transcriptional repressor) of toxin-antitoxin stability system